MLQDSRCRGAVFPVGSPPAPLQTLWFISQSCSQCLAIPYGWSQWLWTLIASCGMLPPESDCSQNKMKKNNPPKPEKSEGDSGENVYPEAFFSGKKKSVLISRAQYKGHLHSWSIGVSVWRRATSRRAGENGRRVERRTHAAWGMGFTLNVTWPINENKAVGFELSQPSLVFQVRLLGVVVHSNLSLTQSHTNSLQRALYFATPV